MALPTKEVLSLEIRSSEKNKVQYSATHVKNLPPGTITEFGWKDYCPSVFRLLQELDSIDRDDYMLSICCDEILKKVSSRKPGNLFLLSKDDRFVIQLLRKSEVKMILEMLPNYYSHLKKYRASLLFKLYGVHVVKPVGGLKVYFAVMANTLEADVLMHRCYDLKGSSRGRTASKVKVREKIILKDSDFDFCFFLDPLTRQRLLMQIKFDCEFLEAEGVMDYSLLLGMHVKSVNEGLLDGQSTIISDTSQRGSVDSRLPNYGASKDLSVSCQTPSDPNRASLDSRSSSPRQTVRSDLFLENEETELDFCDNWLQNCPPKFGVQMPARAVRISRKENGIAPSQWSIGGAMERYDERESEPGQGNDETSENYDVLLYFGIVDSFQNYGVRKRIEHAYKSLQHDSKSISSVKPKVYSSRFQKFISQIFQEEESDGNPTSHNR